MLTEITSNIGKKGITQQTLFYFILVLFFFSGLSSIIYEVLWLRQLRLLFGSSSIATSTTLTVFFLGLALGGYYWGKKASKLQNLLRTYALIEFGIGFSAILYFFILKINLIIYSSWVSIISDWFGLSVIVKFVLSMFLLFPASWFIGGTLPLMGHFLVNKKEEFGSKVSMLYGFNTLGATAGAILAGFYLPVLFGFTLSYTMAIIINFSIAVAVLILCFSLNLVNRNVFVKNMKLNKDINPYLSNKKVLILIFFSGFIVLGLEVLWTQMFIQVAVNDIYSFSLILTVILISLTTGAFVGKFLIKSKYDPLKVIYILFIISGILVGITPIIFNLWTNGLTPIQTDVSFNQYFSRVFMMAIGIFLIPGIVIATIFPFLLKLVQGIKKPAGETLGIWISVNVLGGTLGSLTSGFILIKLLGLWQSIGLMASIYFFLSIIMVNKYTIGRIATRSIIAATLIIIFLFIVPFNMSFLNLKLENNEMLIDIYQGYDGIITVVKAHPAYYPEWFDDLFIRLNNHYTLGGVGSLGNEKRQAHLPLFLHKNPESVFFLGMGTGITAGAALHHDVERVVVTEVVPEVVEAAKVHFTAYTNRLFIDKRANIFIDDGRNYLFGTNETFDVIISDLFNPRASGIGSLYSTNHFQTVKNHLNKNGIFGQWLPLYQLSNREFGVIVRTFLEVFPHSTIWRGNFSPDKPTVVLIGYVTQTQLAPDKFIENIKKFSENNDKEVVIDFLLSVKGLGVLTVKPQRKEFIISILPQITASIPFTFYVGNLALNKDKFSQYYLNTDEKPLIEFLAPKSIKGIYDGGIILKGKKFEKIFGELISNSPDHDPYLERLSKEQNNFVSAGLDYYKFNLYEFYYQSNKNKYDQVMSEKYMEVYLGKIGLNHPK